MDADSTGALLRREADKGVAELSVRVDGLDRRLESVEGKVGEANTKLAVHDEMFRTAEVQRASSLAWQNDKGPKIDRAAVAVSNINKAIWLIIGALVVAGVSGAFKFFHLP